MASQNGINWEGLTGKPMERITQEDINTVVVGKLLSIEQNTKCLKAHDEKIKKHDTYFWLLGCAITLLGIPIVLKLLNVY